jgi:fatty-acyl-CoA synthase
VLETERYAAPVEPGSGGDRSFARLGTAVPGLEIRIVSPESGRVRKEREVGELQIRGTSVCAGYYKRPELNSELFDGEWLRTGDLGYLVDGELVLCGRIKDVIIVGGRNVFPEDIERACNDIDGVRAGNVIAFGVDTDRGKEGLVVVAESKQSHDELEPVRRLVSDRVRDVVGLPAPDVVFVAPGTNPKTSSGKLQRALCRQQYLERGLQPA